MASDKSPSLLRFLILSKTSYDKRCTGNTILCQQLFDVHKVTTKPVEKTVDFTKHGLKISVMDTPGLMDSGVTAKKISQNIEYCLKGEKEGFNAIVLVFRYPTRLTPEENEAVQCMKSLIGEEVMKQYGIVVFTNGQSFKRPGNKSPRENFHDYITMECQSQDEESFGKLLKLMPNRYIFLDNDSDIDDDINDKEIKYLFHLASSNQELMTFYRASLVTNTYYNIFAAIPGVKSIMNLTCGLFYLAYKWWFNITDPDVYIDESTYDHLDDLHWDKPGLIMAEGGEDILASEAKIDL